MSTTKPGQIRCPTCLRSTPPAAFCTQCGAPIPASARIRPRGMDRDELEERIRGRRPGDSIFRRGAPIDEGPETGGYVPFQPEPEDALATRGQEPGAKPNVDNIPPDDVDAAVPPPPARDAYRPPEPEPQPPYAERQYDEPQYDQQYAASGYEPDDAGGQGYEPDQAYPYPYPQRGGGGRAGGALPVLGFVALCALALAVGAVLAGMLGGSNGVGQATPTPTIGAATATPLPLPSESVAESQAPGDSATPEPTDGPVVFPDGAAYMVDPCGTMEFLNDLSGCQVDGSVRDDGNVWILIVFDDAFSADTLTLSLRSNGETLSEVERELGSIIDCDDPCSGLIWGASYRDLLPGDYELVVRRNGDFADRGSFRVED